MLFLVYQIFHQPNPITFHRWRVYHFCKGKHQLEPSEQSPTKLFCQAGQILYGWFAFISWDAVSGGTFSVAANQFRAEWEGGAKQ